MRCCRGPPAKQRGVGSASRRNPGPSPPPQPTSALSSRDRAPFGGGTWGGFTSLWAQAPRDGPGTLCPRCHRACDDSAESTALSECSFRLFAKSKAVASLALEGGSGDPPSPAHHECLLMRASCARAVPRPRRAYLPPSPCLHVTGLFGVGSRREPGHLTSSCSLVPWARQHCVQPHVHRDHARRDRHVPSALRGRPPQLRWRRAAPSGRTGCRRRRVAIARDETASCRPP